MPIIFDNKKLLSQGNADCLISNVESKFKFRPSNANNGNFFKETQNRRYSEYSSNSSSSRRNKIKKTRESRKHTCKKKSINSQENKPKPKPFILIEDDNTNDNCNSFNVLPSDNQIEEKLNEYNEKIFKNVYTDNSCNTQKDYYEETQKLTSINFYFINF